LNKKIDKPALSAYSRLEGDFFFDAVIFSHNHYQFKIPAGSQADFTFHDTSFTALGA